MIHGTCQTCKAFGDERVLRRDRSDKVKGNLMYGSCRVKAPMIGSEWINSGAYGDAVIGAWPYVSYDDWCLLWVEGGDRTAKTVEVKSITFE